MMLFVFLRSPLAFVLDVLAYTDFSNLDCAPTLCFLQDGKISMANRQGRGEQTTAGKNRKSK
jgi:hypothetical protein